ncbi:hypothetical protein BLX88_25685, partial [Bacillus obstructivus]
LLPPPPLPPYYKNLYIPFSLVENSQIHLQKSLFPLPQIFFFFQFFFFFLILKKKKKKKKKKIEKKKKNKFNAKKKKRK